VEPHLFSFPDRKLRFESGADREAISHLGEHNE